MKVWKKFLYVHAELQLFKEWEFVKEYVSCLSWVNPVYTLKGGKLQTETMYFLYTQIQEFIMEWKKSQMN